MGLRPRAPLRMSYAEGQPSEPQTPWATQQEIFDGSWQWWRAKFEATDELKSFLHGDRYVDDGGQFVRDRRGIQIVGQEVADTVNHVVAMATARARSVEGRPKDSEGDADLAEAMVALINNELDNPAKGYKREEYMALQECREGRRGVVWMDKVDNYGPFGAELFWGFQPNGTVMWDPAYHPHHPLCQWVIRHKRIDYRQANRDYGVDWLKPDYEQLEETTRTWKKGIPLANGFSDRVASECIHDQRVTIREVWIKNDPTVNPDRPATKRRRKLKASDRYMRCMDGCSSLRSTDPTVQPWRSPTQGAMMAQGLMSRAFPPTMPGAQHEGDPSGCPTCGGPLERIDAEDLTQQQLMYQNGRRMICVAPFCPGPDGNTHLYDGAWPIPSLRSFPALFVFASVKPGDNSGGPCDVDRMWHQQVASDNMMTLAVQRVFEHRDYWRMPTVGFYNVRGERFEFREDDENVIYEDKRKTRDYGQGVLEHISGTGLDAGWMPVYQTLQNALLAFRPKADVSPKEGEARNVPVGTTQLQIQQAETTTEDFVRRVNDERGMLYGVVEDGIRATYTPERLARLNIEGTDHLLELWGEALPNYDYTITEAPNFTGLDKAKADAFQGMLGAYQQAATMGLDPMAAVELFAEINNVPKSVSRKFVRLLPQQPPEPPVAPGGEGPPMPGAGASEGPPPLAPGAMNNAGPNAGGIPLPAVA